MHVQPKMQRRVLTLAGLATVAALLVVVALPARSQQPPDAPDAALPDRGQVIDIDSPERALYKIAVPNLLGTAPLGAQGADVLRNDFKLVSLFQVLDSRSFLADPTAEGLNLAVAPWQSVGAQGVIKGEIRGTGGALEIEMRFYELAHGTTATLTHTYHGGPGQLRGFMHDFANEVLRQLTGTAGAFGTRIAFARRIGPGRKDIYTADFDGDGVGRVSSGQGNAMLPAFGPGGVWYTLLTRLGSIITHTGTNEQAIISSTTGLNMGPTICGGRVVFTTTRDENSEIYSAALDGSDVRRLTHYNGIDVSPTCGPGGQIAFVSDRNGGPQIFVMDSSGGGVRRVTFRGGNNQTPAFCPDPSKHLLAFTGRDAGMDIFTLNLQTQQYTRLTQGQGINKDPAFSPDCRMVAFARVGAGIFISNPEGLNQNLVIRGDAETLRWQH